MNLAPKIIITTTKASFDMPAIQSFYNLCGYTGPVNSDDDMVIAFEGFEIVGVVRLVSEQGVSILRGMNIREDRQRCGIGSKMLQEFKRMIEKRKVAQVYLICGPHLETYYRQIDFIKVDSIDSIPGFLVDRMKGYQAKYGPQIILRRSED